MALSAGKEESSSDGSRFRPGDLVRVLGDDLSLRRSQRHTDIEWDDTWTMYAGQVGVIEKSLNEGRCNVAFIWHYSKGADSLPGFVDVDQRGQIALFHVVFSETSLKPCLTACFLPGEMAVVYPNPDFVTFVNRFFAKVDDFEAWCGQLVRVEDTVFGMVTVRVMDAEWQDRAAKKTIELTPTSLIPVLLNDSERWLAGGANSVPWQDAIVVHWRDELVDPHYESVLESSQKPTSDDLKAFYRSIEAKDANGTADFVIRYPNAVDVGLGPAGETALMYAVKTNEPSTVNLLLQSGARPLHKSDDGLSSFDIFFELEHNGDLRILDRLLDYALPDANVVGNGGLTPLLEAVARRFLPCLRLLLESTRVDVNAQDRDGRTAMHHVILSEFDESEELLYASLLLKHHADILIPDNSGFTSFHLAAKVGKFRLLMRMLNMHEGVSDVRKETDGWTALHLAAVNGHCEIVEELAKNDWCSTSIKTLDGHSVMYLMVVTLYVEVYKRHNAGVDGRTYRTDLFRVVDLLVESGASIDVCDYSGTESDSRDDSPVHMAMHQLCLAMVNGRQPSKRIIEELFLLDKKSEELKLVEDLLPICEAWPQLAVVCFFLAKGADVSLLNAKQMTVLESSPVEVRFLLYSYHRRYRDRSILSREIVMEGKTEVDSTRVCLFCESIPNVTFSPCGHSAPFCSSCANRDAVISIKRCSTCRQPIANRFAFERCSILLQASVDDDLKFCHTLRQLEELKSAITCQICADRETNVVFQCGHLLCEECSEKLTKCPFCLKRIEARTRMYRS